MIELEGAVGWSVIDGLALGVAVLAQVGGAELEYKCPEAMPMCGAGAPETGSVGALSIMADWYSSANAGFNLFTSVGVARAEVRGDDAMLSDMLQDSISYGLLVSLGAGVEWWLVDDLALGAMLRLSGYSTQKDGASVGGLGLSIDATLTYN